MGSIRLENVSKSFGEAQVISALDLDIEDGAFVVFVGPSGCGKSTLLRLIAGLEDVSGGRILIDGKDVTGWTTAQRVKAGVSMVPENRRLFKRMTVRENLEIGAYLREDRENIEEDMERIFEIFPRVKERLNQKAGTLSGGEQQMVAMGRALMARPKVLLMDEPSMGLAPVLVAQNFEIIEQINKAGTTIFMVEQNANMALSIADRGYVLQTGQVVLADTAEALLANPQMRKAYLGET